MSVSFNAKNNELELHTPQKPVEKSDPSVTLIRIQKKHLILITALVVAKLGMVLLFFLPPAGLILYAIGAGLAIGADNYYKKNPSATLLTIQIGEPSSQKA